jgi:hypothetical protein
MRISEHSRVEASADRREHAEGAWRRYTAAVDTMNTADDAEDFQAIGVKCREALLALARENRDASWVGDVADPPQADNLKGWMEIFAARLVPDRWQRACLKDLTDKTWDIAVGLQHNTNATPFDAELVLNSVQHLLGFFMLVRVKHKQGLAERCPRCGSYRLVPTGELGVVADEEGYASWTICASCDWESDREFECFTDWREQVGDRLDEYLDPGRDGPPMPNDGLAATKHGGERRYRIPGLRALKQLGGRLWSRGPAWRRHLVVGERGLRSRQRGVPFASERGRTVLEAPSRLCLADGTDRDMATGRVDAGGVLGWWGWGVRERCRRGSWRDGAECDDGGRCVALPELFEPFGHCGGGDLAEGEFASAGQDGESEAASVVLFGAGLDVDRLLIVGNS